MLKQNSEQRDVAKAVIRAYVLVVMCVVTAAGYVSDVESKTVEDAKQLIRVKNFQGAADVLKDLALKGDAEAQYMLAVMVRNGHGVDRDLTQAFKWFFKAAQSRHVKAQYEVGMCYKNGLGVQKDTSQARLWLSRAAQQNYAQAKEQLSRLGDAPAVHDSAEDNFFHAQHAITNNENQLLSRLIEHFNINKTDKQGNSLLHTASQSGNHAAAKYLLQKGINRQLRNRNENTALAIAINENKTAIIPLLLDKSRINDRYEAGATAMILAARNGGDDIIRQLSKLGADVSLKDKLGLNALDYAEKRNHVSTRVLLTSLGAKATRPTTSNFVSAPVERTDFYNGWTDLMIAAWKGNDEQCRVALKKDRIDAKDPQGYSALMRAAMKNHVKTISLLLLNNADINLQNEQGETALLLAATQGQVEAMNVLLQHKPDLNRAAKNGTTPLIAAVRIENPDIIRMLISAKADVNAQQDNASTALHQALNKQQIAVAAQLLDSGARFDLYDNQGRTALHLAALQNQGQLLDKMITAGANVNLMDKSGYTLLSYVAESGSTQGVANLIRRGADVNQVSRRGNNTPLLLAAEKGLADTVNILLEKTTDINHKNNYGNTALMLAAKNGHDAVVSLLLDKGAKANIRNQNKNTALDLARAENKTAVVELISRHQSASESWLDILK